MVVMVLEELTEQELIEFLHQHSVIEEVALDQLHIDRSYQRDPSQALVDTIANNWDEIASELILVSDRGNRDEALGVKGGRWIVNGQHRTIAARKLQKELIWARVVDLSGADDPGRVEAGLRLKLNVKQADGSLERFKAQVRAGDEASIAIVEMLARFDTQINQVPTQDNGINAVSTVETIYNADEGSLLYDTIALLKDAYGNLGGRIVSAGMMRAIAWFIEKHAFETDRYRTLEKLKDTGPEALFRKAINYQSVHQGSLWMNYYRALVEIYNERLTEKNRIEWRLKGAGGFGNKKNPTIRWHSKDLGDL